MSWLDEQDAAKVEEALVKFRTSPSYEQYVNDYVGGDERFGLWLRMVDSKMMRNVGVTHRDIGDWHWHDMFTGCYSPSEAAQEALENDDTYSMFMAGE